MAAISPREPQPASPAPRRGGMADGRVIRALLARVSPTECAQFETEFCYALDQAGIEFDLTAVEEMLTWWWEIATARSTPSTVHDLSAADSGAGRAGEPGPSCCPNTPTTRRAPRTTTRPKEAGTTMGALSPTHWLIVVGVLVLLFGAKRLPDAARSLGRSARILKAEVKDMNPDTNPDTATSTATTATASPAELPPVRATAAAGASTSSSSPAAATDTPAAAAVNVCPGR